jgi:DNA anti-recombination protein RmuC
MDNTLKQNDRHTEGVTIYDQPDNGVDTTSATATTKANLGTERETVAASRLRYEETLEEDVSRNVTFQDGTPNELEHRIEQTQERIAENIDELTKRLNPTRMKDQAVQSLSESLNLKGLQHMVGDLRGTLKSSVQDSGVKMLEGVKHNPASAALLGVGAGLLAVGGVMAAKTDVQASETHSVYDERMRGMVNTIESSNMEQGSGKYGLQYEAQRAKDGLGRVLESQPIAVGAVALLAGAAIGLLLPRTRYEDSLMGERSDQLISRAKGKASEVVDVAKSTATDVVQTAKETVGEVVQTAKTTAKETVKAATAA